MSLRSYIQCFLNKQSAPNGPPHLLRIKRKLKGKFKKIIKKKEPS
uniref:Uncharacterized protein n=1 Tax=Rhizophora mucronata TaxID=61149 RepID=A0A2P2QGR1_RHIMU